MVQQRVQVLIKYVVCMGATTLLNNNMAVLFTVLTRRGGCGGKTAFVEFTLVACSWACVKCVVLPQRKFSREVIERRAFQTVFIPYK